MKVLIIHPPLYLVNIEFFNLLGNIVDLRVVALGEYPRSHPEWHVNNLRHRVENFQLTTIGTGYITTKKSLNPFIIREIIKQRPDIVVSIAFWLPGFYALVIKYIFGYRLLISTDAIVTTERNINTINKLYRKILLFLSDGCIAASPDTVDYLRTLLPKKMGSKIHLSRQTVNVTEWMKAGNHLADKNTLKMQLGIPRDKRVLLGVGAITRKKNWIRVLEIMMSLDEDIIFVLVGSGDQLSEIKSRTELLKLAGRVIIAGEKSGLLLSEYYKATDIFILPSLYDQFGFVVVEALSSGLPVICSKYAGSRCFIKDGYNGYVIDPDDDFSSSINSALSNSEEMGRNALKTAYSSTFEKKVKEFRTIFDSTLNVIG